MSNINNSEEEEIRILKNIEQLQNMEKALYQELESGSNISSDAAANWTKIGQEGSYVTVGPNTTVRYGLPGKFIESVKSGGFIVTNSTMGGDPVPGSLKIIESKSNNSSSMPSKNVDSIVNRINQLSEVRMSLYKSLNYTYQSLQKNVNTSRTELVELLTVVGIVEDELNNAKIQLNQLYEIKNNKMRMVEINTYYGKRYRAQSGVMKLIIFVCVILLVLAILRKKSLLPESIANILLGIVIAVGGFFIIWRVLDISWRDNMNFDAYTWHFNPDAKQRLPSEYKAPEINLPKIDCIGNACCTDGMIYDANIRKCIKGVAPETFVSGQLTKHCFNNKPEGKKNPMTNPIPYGSDDTINFASV
jgi:hypothetical protein